MMIMRFLEPELFNPKDENWYPMAPMEVDRLYHANALLLPDGRVMTAGSNPDRRMNELRIELFRPPYLFRGKRPMISKYPKRISYNQGFEIETNDANHIKAVALIRQSVTTHCVNTEQRYIELEHTQQIRIRFLSKFHQIRILYLQDIICSLL